jgi:hypothetical protein
MSNKSSFFLWFKSSPDRVHLTYHSQQRFPDNAKGFFYYNIPPPPFPPIMADLRFRITSSSDPSSFNDGSDLLNGLGLVPWSLPILRLAQMEKYRDICEQLVAEGLISRELLERCHLILKNSLTSRGFCPHHFLYHLNQPILLTFNHRCSYLMLKIVGKDRFSQWWPKHPYFKKSLSGTQTQPPTP